MRGHIRSNSHNHPPLPSSPLLPPHGMITILFDKEKKKSAGRAARKRDACKELCKIARKENDSMVYLDGPRIYTCGECRTHLMSHDEVISKSYHGRHAEFIRSLIVYI